MNTSGEVADLIVREGIQLTESAAKLAGLGAKNLAAIVYALIKDDNKLQGKTTLKNLLKADKPLCILQMREDDLKKFRLEAKKYGVLFTVVTDKSDNGGLCDIIAKQDDITKLNYIIEKLGLNAPVVANETEQEQDASEKNNIDTKKVKPRVKEKVSERPSMDSERGDKSPNKKKQSVKAKVENYKRKQRDKKRSSPQKTKKPKAKSRG